MAIGRSRQSSNEEAVAPSLRGEASGQCPHCGAALRSDYFCPQCRRIVRWRDHQDARPTCSHCGAEMVECGLCLGIGEISADTDGCPRCNGKGVVCPVCGGEQSREGEGGDDGR